VDLRDQSGYRQGHRRIFYGWWIVGIGALTQIAGVFSLSSTLSVFLKPITDDLGVSRGAFSLVRTSEVLVSAALAPFVGPLIDRHGGRSLIVIGAIVASLGYMLLSRVQEFWQFFLLRCTLVVVGDTLMGSMVVMVIISRWFIRKRGRAIAIANLGTGIAKVSMPLLAASLFVWVGWRETWTVFGILALALVVWPTLAFLRSSPEEMGLHPDGEPVPRPMESSVHGETELSATQRQALAADVPWTRVEALRTRAFWLLVITFGIASVGIAGLNLHVFAFVTDLGYPPITAATIMSTIAITQLGSTLFWGLLAERVDIRKAAMGQFLTQTLGLTIAVTSTQLRFVYVGFFLYGIGLGGSFVLREVVWANYFGRLSLGTVRGMGMFLTQIFSASGAPFFGFLFDATGSYFISFTLFSSALLLSAGLIMLVQPPKKPV
jgi:OFA family oxalate/formate antiporter-like MFS transporter